MKDMLEKLRDFPPKRILIIIAIASTITIIALFLEMRRIDALLMRSGYGIVDFELAFSIKKASTILGSWGENLAGIARRSLILDFAFLVSYGLCLSSITLLISRKLESGFQALGLGIALLPMMAALFDASENILLLNFMDNLARMVVGNMIVMRYYLAANRFIFLAGICASLKFFLLGIVFLFIVLGGGYALFRKFKSI
jgi:predicted neutral ceramidase superfamily lipid hydrolase